MLVVYVLVSLLLLGGLLGSVLPLVPGTPLILAGTFVYAVATDFHPVGPWHLLVLLVLAAVAYGLDYLAAAAGVRKLGGSWWAVGGAVLGALAGVFLGPLGWIVGPIAGAVLVELLVSKKIRTGLRSGLGTVVGMLLGMAAEFSVALIMVGLFLWWVRNG